jgi:hypothetical protein
MSHLCPHHCPKPSSAIGATIVSAVIIGVITYAVYVTLVAVGPFIALTAWLAGLASLVAVGNVVRLSIRSRRALLPVRMPARACAARTVPMVSATVRYVVRPGRSRTGALRAAEPRAIAGRSVITGEPVREPARRAVASDRACK